MTSNIKIANAYLMQKEIPECEIFKPNKLYRVVDPFVMGIEFISVSNNKFRPHFVIYPLWKNDVEECLSAPYLLQEIYNVKGRQFTVCHDEYTAAHTELIDCINKQTPLLLAYINLEVFLSLIEKAGKDDILIKSSSSQQAKLFELKFHASLFLNEHKKILGTLNDIKKHSTIWDFKLFNYFFGDFDTWYNYLD